MNIHWISADGGLQQAQLVGNHTPLGPAGALLETARGAIWSLVSNVGNAVVGFAESLVTNPEETRQLLRQYRIEPPEVLQRDPPTLVKRILHETQGVYARSVHERNEVAKVGEACTRRAAIDRENIPESPQT